MKKAYQRFVALASLVVSLPVLALLAGEAETADHCMISFAWAAMSACLAETAAPSIFEVSAGSTASRA